MGQTLTHGVYLPDEGERNCYNGLAANWSILDGAVGTVAEHTSALSGKAPLVHTHSKSDITDFPAYGTTAGTICEGNDSRLSDARTPVAHTHTKSDVTDLLNSNFIPSANNSYDLGSSSYQWNNLYAKNYYYNGTAWGLDKANVWSKENTFTAHNINIQQPFTLGDNTYQVARLQILDSAPTPQRLGTFNFIQYTNNLSRLEMGIYGLNSNNEIKNRFLLFQLEPDGTSSFFPLNNSQINLGTSTNKWKTLNGINPGALSLPDVTDGDPISTVGWSLTGARNTYTPTENGWFFIRVKGTASARCSLNIHSGSYNDNYPTWVSFNDPAISLSTSLVVPAQKSVNLYVYIIAAEIEQLIFFPCLGNV